MAQDGLPSEVIQAFAQTPDHYLWIGTMRGLLRFDGDVFTLFNRDNTPALNVDNVFCLMATHDGSLWIGTEGGGLVRYQHGIFHRFSAEEGVTDNAVRAVYEDSAGGLWIGTDDGLFKSAGKHFVRVDGTDSIPQLSVHAIVGDGQGGIWAGGTALLHVSRSGVHEYPLGNRMGSLRVKSIVETRDGSIWVGAVSGLYQMKPGGGFMHINQVPGTVRVLRETSDGVLWAGTIGNGLYARNKDGFQRMDLVTGLPGHTVLNLFEDTEKNIWIGAQAGLLRLTRSAVKVYQLPDASDSDFGNVYIDRDGTVWLCSNRLYRMQSGALRPYVFAGMGDVKVRLMMRDRSGALWVGTDGNGFYRYAGGHWTNFNQRKDSINDYSRAMIEDRDGSIWMGTDGGAFHLAAKGAVAVGPKGDSTMALLQDAKGDIWMGTFQGLVHWRRDHAVDDAATQALRSATVWALHESRDGSLWIGTNAGLYRFKDGRTAHFTTARGLVGNLIYSIQESSDGRVWLSGPDGISLLSIQQMNQAADDPSRSLAVMFYAPSSEMESAELYGSMQPAGAISPQGDVWFPSNKGLVHAAAGGAVQRDSFPLVIDKVVADGREVQGQAQPIVLSPGNATLELSFEPVLLGSQAGVRFRYELEGLDKDWRETSSSRIAEYGNLAPGNYVFRVAAFRPDHQGPIAEVSLAILQTAHIYRRPWFLACAGLLMLALVLLIYRLRIQRMRARFRIVLAERNRLAREVHDTVLQGCTNVSLLLEAASSIKPSDSASADEMVGLARNQIRATAVEARQAIWNWRSSDAPHQDIVTSLQRIAEQTSRQSGIPVSVRATGSGFPLNSSALHELLMIAREAIHNAVHHSKGAHIHADIGFSPGRLTIDVGDDGCGFDMAQTGNGSNRSFGIKGMQERAQRIGAAFNLESAIGAGTRVKIEISQEAASAKAELMGV